MKKVLFVVVVVLMMVGFISGSAFAEANWNTGFDASPAFVEYDFFGLDSYVINPYIADIELGFCALGSHIRVVPGNANANANSVVSDFYGYTLVDPWRAW